MTRGEGGQVRRNGRRKASTYVPGEGDWSVPFDSEASLKHFEAKRHRQIHILYQKPNSVGEMKDN